MATQTLHERIAKTLNWKLSDVHSTSLQSLRELVRPVNPNLANEISSQITSGAYMTRKGRRE